MIGKLKELGYDILIKYFSIGIITGFFIFEIVKQILTNNTFSFNELFNRESITLFIAVILGALTGGLIYIIMIINNKRQQEYNKVLWENNLSKNQIPFILIYMITFPFSGFIGLLTKNILELNNHNFASLFSRQNNIDYISFIFAMAVLGLFVSIGRIKQSYYLFHTQNREI